MAFILRASAGQPNWRPQPKKADHRPRASSSAPSSVSSGQSPAPAPPPSGGFPVWCLPFLAASAAMPIYGYHKQSKLIEEAHARQAARLAAGEKTPAPAPAKKSA